MHIETKCGTVLHKGLQSPGPMYPAHEICFKEASKRCAPGRPSWGPPPRHDAQKLSRARTDEVRFTSRAGGEKVIWTQVEPKVMQMHVKIETQRKAEKRVRKAAA